MKPFLERVSEDLVGDEKKSLIYAGTKGDRKHYSVKLYFNGNAKREMFPRIRICIQKRKFHKVVFEKKDTIIVVPKTWEQQIGKLGAHIECQADTAKFLKWFMQGCEAV